MSDEWIGIIHTTRPKYMKGASDLTVRKRLLLSMLKKRGRIIYNQSGDECKWQVEYSQPTVETYADGGVINFSNHDAFKQLSHDWRGYVATDSMTKKQNAMNKGEEALIKLFQTKSNRLTKSITDNFSGELYKDGSAAGRESAIHGLETFMTAGTVAAGDRIAMCNDSYGGLTTDLGDYGGSWSTNLSTSPNSTLATDWPDGQGSSEYDFISPKLVNWSSTAWGTSSTAWEDNCWRVISQAITWLTTTGGQDGQPSLIVLSSDLMQGYKNHHETLRRINVPHKEAQDLGFGDVLNQDGVAIMHDFDCPATVGYCINVNMMEVRSLMPELFWMEGPDKDPRTLWSYLWGIGFFGNVKFEPKHFGKLDNYA